MEIRVKYEVDEIYKDVEFFADVVEEDIGIGSYEFWGARGFDSQIVPVIQGNIEWDKKIYTEEENKVIEKYLNMYFDTIEELIYENY